jgi:hypothetical protein
MSLLVVVVSFVAAVSALTPTELFNAILSQNPNKTILYSFAPTTFTCNPLALAASPYVLFACGSNNSIVDLQVTLGGPITALSLPAIDCGSARFPGTISFSVGNSGNVSLAVESVSNCDTVQAFDNLKQARFRSVSFGPLRNVTLAKISVNFVEQTNVAIDVAASARQTTVQVFGCDGINALTISSAQPLFSVAVDANNVTLLNLSAPSLVKLSVQRNKRLSSFAAPTLTSLAANSDNSFVVVNNVALTSIDLPALRNLTRAPQIDGAVLAVLSMPMLTNIIDQYGSLTIKLPALVSLSLPSLANMTCSLTIYDCLRLATVSLPALRSAKSISVGSVLGGNPVLTGVEWSQLAQVDYVIVRDNPALLNVSFPSLIGTRNRVEVSNNDALRSVSFGTDTTGNFSRIDLSNNPSLSSVQLPVMSTVDSVLLRNCSFFGPVPSLPNLRKLSLGLSCILQVSPDSNCFDCETVPAAAKTLCKCDPCGNFSSRPQTSATTVATTTLASKSVTLTTAVSVSASASVASTLKDETTNGSIATSTIVIGVGDGATNTATTPAVKLILACLLLVATFLIR